MAQVVKCLLYGEGDLSSQPNTYRKSQITNTGEAETGGSLPATHSDQNWRAQGLGK